MEKREGWEIGTSRRTLLRMGVALLVSGLPGRVAAQQKIAQKMVQYQDKPKGAQTCDTCLHFIAPNACKVVEGKINPKGWCSLFVLKPK